MPHSLLLLLLPFLSSVLCFLHPKPRPHLGLQPVWMVVNLQGKIKGSYTTDKMVEFCRRGTLGGAQLVLGLDRNLPYNARQVCMVSLGLCH
jgi:hypothetical protein